MSDQNYQNQDQLRSLQERAKELNCLYRLEELVNKPDASLQEVCQGVVEAIPPGWQYPEICQAEISLDNLSCRTPNFSDTPWKQCQEIELQGRVIGRITVCYTKEMPEADEGPFLRDESRLLGTIADRIGQFITLRKMKEILQELEAAKEELPESGKGEWRVILNMLRQTDRDLYLTVSQKMLNQLAVKGLREAQNMLLSSVSAAPDSEDVPREEENRPLQKAPLVFSDTFCKEIFEIASRDLRDEQILDSLQKWIQEDKLGFLVEISDQSLLLEDVISAVRHYRKIAQEGIELPESSKRAATVALIRRLLSDQLSFINMAKKYIDIDDFSEILERIIFTSKSYGRLGGKSTGLFLAWQILKKSGKLPDNGMQIKIPKSWYITSDVLLEFLRFNNLNEVTEQKYKDIDQVRMEYPHIVQTFKQRPFPTEIVRSLSVLLDEMGERPMIVRSSSLLEDRLGAAFSGKYKSLFLANQGTKAERMAALLDAIAEVYASTFGPDPIEYRSERGLLDFYEEMGILIQEVVGTQVGNYYFPCCAGVAFSRNDFRWSPRIKTEDGLARLVIGLGTRAVDRLSNDYPILIAPGKPSLRVNVTIDDVVRYAPRFMDAINLEKNAFETIELGPAIRAMGSGIPAIEKLVSIYEDDYLRKPLGFQIDFERDKLICSFEGLIGDTKFIPGLHSLLGLLENSQGTPVELEFAFDGKDFFLLQCRAQSFASDTAPAPIPKDIPEKRIIFTANRYVSNGFIPSITHLVYVDADGYSNLADRSELLSVGRAVSKLNKLLPKRQFILIGPGRWGSRGDIRLGVSVTYSDINNTALLVEVAHKKGSYVPDLSFGTHFFQDLVEAQIRYLPLYPGESGVLFNEPFLRGSANILPEVLPEFESLADTVRLIDIPRIADGHVVQVLMNAELEMAVGFISEPEREVEPVTIQAKRFSQPGEDFWSWRLQVAESIAARLDADLFGVKGFYVFGSTKNATAGPCSDIDLLIHFDGNQQQRDSLTTWLKGWSHCLDEINYQRTGYRTGGLLDVHIVTDEDIAARDSYASKIGAITDAAKPLPMLQDPRARNI